MSQMRIKREKLDYISQNDRHFNNTNVTFEPYAETEVRYSNVKFENETSVPTIEELFANSKPERMLTPKLFQVLKRHRPTAPHMKKEFIVHSPADDTKMDKEQTLTQTYTEMDDLSELESPPTRKRRSSSSKRAGKNGGSPYTTVPLPPCKVCGGIATGYHFGVITCEACKVCTADH